MNKLSAVFFLVCLWLSVVYTAKPNRSAKPIVNKVVSNKACGRHMSHYYDTVAIAALEERILGEFNMYAEDGVLSKEQHLLMNQERVNTVVKYTYTDAQINNWFIALDLDQSGFLTSDEYVPLTAVAMTITQQVFARTRK